MATERYLMENYKRFLLNRTTVTPVIVESIENCLSNEETANQSFHKIMIHNWQDSLPQVFDVLSGYYGSSFIPVHCTSQGELTSFYTSSLNLVMKLIKFDFMFPYSRNMFNVDVLFNDKTASDFFRRVTTVEDIVSGVVCCRFTEKCVLDLSNFCEDKEFVDNKIFFYKLSLLSQFKILMLRMGRDTKKLILSNNNLSQAPVDILNFFIKSDLTAIDLSYNNIPSLQGLHRVSSKIEKLWIEGNPLCEELDPITYVKNIAIKFPRLNELGSNVWFLKRDISDGTRTYHRVGGICSTTFLRPRIRRSPCALWPSDQDGVKFNQHGIVIPFFKHFQATPDKRTKVVIENFIRNYFSNFDTKKGFKSIVPFYEEGATLTIATDFTDAQEKLLPHYGMFHRNLINPEHKKQIATVSQHRLCNSRAQIFTAFSRWPETIHDISTFTVDVMCHNAAVLMATVDGIYKELVSPEHPTENIFQFRRTFMFNIHTENQSATYRIQHEMMNVRFATTEQIRNSFLTPIVNTNSLTPIDPTNEEREALLKVFQHITQLKKTEAELRLTSNSWNIYNAMRDFSNELKNNMSKDNIIQADRFLVEDEDFSDCSSLLDEVD